MYPSSPAHQGGIPHRKTPADGKNAEKENLPTLSQAIETYISDQSNSLSPITIRGYETIWRNRFKGLMSRSLSDISDTDYLSTCNQEVSLCSAKTLKNA